MRTRTPKTVVTFVSTSDAMGFEAAARERGIPGRIIPVPSEISAGCGLAWCAEASERQLLVQAIERWKLGVEGIFEINMY